MRLSRREQSRAGFKMAVDYRLRHPSTLRKPPQCQGVRTMLPDDRPGDLQGCAHETEI
jgi:hypothetical protein